MKLTLHAAVLIALSGFTQSATAQDWAGMYGALSAADVSGDMDLKFQDNLFDSTSETGQLGSLALGYNFQSGNFVYGGEIAFWSGKVRHEDYLPENYLNGLWDIKGRVGYASGRILYFGTLGYSRANTYYSNPIVTNEPVGADGLSVGVGIDYLVSDRVFVGLEAQQRYLRVPEDALEGAPGWNYDHDLRTVGLRLGFKF